MKNKPSLKYVADTHTYTLGDRNVPSVTQVLGLVTTAIYGARIGGGEPTQAMLTGSAIHSILDDYDKGNTAILANHSIMDKYGRYCRAWEMFRNAYKARVVESECRVASVKYGYAGTIDRILEMTINGKRGLHIVDIKTGSTGATPTSRLQTAAYHLAAREWLGIKLSLTRVIVHIPLEGELQYGITCQSNQQDEPAFLSCLAIHKWITENKNNGGS